MQLVSALLVLSLLFPALAGCEQRERVYASDERAYSAFGDDKHRRFDFWIGEWDVNLRMLQPDLTFRDSVRAHASVYSILHGKAILELWDSKPIKGYSLRYYDPQTDRWILWLDWPGKNRSGVSRMQGEFRHGRGEFRSEYETADGGTITQRYTFSDITPFSLRRDDMNSRDGGKTWREIRRMEFTRTALDPHWPLDSIGFPTYDTGARCEAADFRPYESIVGHWHGRIDGNNASISAWHILDDCAVIVFLDIDSKPAKKRFMLMTYDTSREQWETDYLDDDRDSDLLRLVSEEDWSRLRVDEYSLDWSVGDTRLRYTFRYADGAVESGSITRQRLENH